MLTYLSSSSCKGLSCNRFVLVRLQIIAKRVHLYMNDAKELQFCNFLRIALNIVYKPIDKELLKACDTALLHFFVVLLFSHH